MAAPVEGVRTVELLRDLVTRLQHQPRRKLTLLVGVDGRAGSGKSTLTGALAGVDPGITVVEVDDFYRPVAERSQQQGTAGPDEVGADIDWRRLRNQVLLPLQRNRGGWYQRYDWEADRLAEWHDVPCGGIVIVEGVYACMKQLAFAYDFRIWVEAPRERRMARGQERDRDNGNWPLWESVWMPAEDAYVAAQDPAASADLLVDGSGDVPHDPGREYVRIRP
jgi:uridine kinase